MLNESNSEIQIEASTQQYKKDCVYIVQITKYKNAPGVVEFSTHPEYFELWDDANKFIKTLPMTTNTDVEIRYHIQELSKATVCLRLVVSKPN